MGSFSEVCGLSGLPINQGDDVVSVIIDNSYTGRYVAVCPPLFGKYNDYGSIDLSEEYQAYHENIFNIFLSPILEHSYVIVDDKGMSSDIDYTKPTSLQEEVHAVERQKLFGREENKNLSTVRQMFFHADILSAMTSHVFEQYSTSDWDSLITLEEFSELLTIPTFKAPFDTPADELIALQKWSNRISSKLSNWIFFRNFSLVKNDIRDEVIRSLYLVYLTDVTLYELGKTWHPNLLPGGQFYDLDPHLVLINESLKKVEKMRAKRSL